MMPMPPQIYIGTGGWQYFITPGRDPLVEYSKIFNFVEVNATFYKKIPLTIAEKWRKKTPPHFIFSLRTPKIVTHDNLLKPNDQTIKAMNYIYQLADILKSDIIVLETPPRLIINKDKLETFLNRINLEDKYLALEVRGHLSKDAIEYIKKIEEIIPVYDISKEMAIQHKEIDYTRIFGKGEHNIYQFTKKELKTIYTKATNAPVKKILISFHGVRMYTDAGKLRFYHLYKEFPKNKPPYGLEAIKTELLRDMNFPATRDEIIKHEGWKVIPLNEKDDIHIGDILSWLPPKIYKNPNEVIEELRKTNLFK